MSVSFVSNSNFSFLLTIVSLEGGIASVSVRATISSVLVSDTLQLFIYQTVLLPAVQGPGLLYHIPRRLIHIQSHQYLRRSQVSWATTNLSNFFRKIIANFSFFHDQTPKQSSGKVNYNFLPEHTFRLYL